MNHSTRKTFTAVLIVILLAVWSLPLAAGQNGDFPRTVMDDTGASLTIPARPAVVAVLGEVPALPLLLQADERRDLDPTDLAPDWQEVGLLVLPELHAASYRGLVDAAEAAGIPVFQVRAVTGLDPWHSLVTRLGTATGRDDRAAEVLARLEKRLTAIHESINAEMPRRVLVLTPEGYTFGQNTLLTELVSAAGGINVAAEAGYQDYRQLDDTAIRDLAPDVILLSPAWSPDAADSFRANPAYETVPAVQQGQVYRLPFSPTQPADPGAAVVALAILFHPAALLL
jgi:ABC-type Fe3+-hydroxamate transport system substrate-binding protein